MGRNIINTCLITVIFIIIFAIIYTISMYAVQCRLAQTSSHGNSSVGNIMSTTEKTVPTTLKTFRFFNPHDNPNNGLTHSRSQILDTKSGIRFFKSIERVKRRSRRDTSQPVEQDNVGHQKKGKDVKKDTEIDINAQFPSGQSSDKVLEDRFSHLINTLMEKIRTEGQADENLNPDIDEEDDEENAREQKILNSRNKGQLPTVKPALECDEWDTARGICYYDRNVGDTITFQLRFENLHHGHVTHVIWKQEYHIKNSNHTKFVEISPEDSLWNIVIGSNGREFRVSPITEIDFDFNHFSAIVTISEADLLNHVPITRKVAFAIRPVPNDLGSVYRGEQLVLNVESFGSLPMESLQYHWYIEREAERSTLPSNMKVSPTGSAVVISELRTEQEGIISCAVYNAKSIFLTKKRFLIKEINRDILIHGPHAHSANKGKQINFQIEDRVLRRKVRQVDPVQMPIQTESTNVGGTSEIFPTKQTGLNPLYLQQPYVRPVNALPQTNAGRPDDNQGIPQFDQSMPMVDTNNPQQQPQVNPGQSNIQPCLHPPCVQSEGISQDNRQMPLIPQNNVGPSSQQQSEMGYQDTRYDNRVSFQNPNFEQNIDTELNSRLPESSQKLMATAEGRVAEILSECVTDRECSGHASCVQMSSDSKSFCRCRGGYRGSGLFCWEMIIPGRPAVIF